METGSLLAGGTLAAIAAVFLVALAILWFLLPFAVFGIKARLDRAIELQEAILRALGGATPGARPRAGAADPDARRKPGLEPEPVVGSPFGGFDHDIARRFRADRDQRL